MKKLKMGVLGCSGHFSRISKGLASSRLFESYGIASRNAQKAGEYAQKWGLKKSYGSYEELLSDPDIDFVYCPLPNNLHFEYIKKSADGGKPILCEKPLTLNAKEAAQAAEYCAKKGVLLMEAFMFRFHPQWIQAAQIIKSGELGKIMSTAGFFSYDNKDAMNIRNIAQNGGGALLDIGCYAVSAARIFMGSEPQRAAASVFYDPVFKTDIFSSAMLDFGDGRVSNFSVSTQLFPWQRVRAAGTKGTMALEVPFNMRSDSPGRLLINTDLDSRTIETETADQFLQIFDAFALAVSEKKTEAPTPASDAIANMAVIDSLFASAKSGKWERVEKY